MLTTAAADIANVEKFKLLIAETKQRELKKGFHTTKTQQQKNIDSR
jgi:hypothetical protein